MLRRAVRGIRCAPTEASLLPEALRDVWLGPAAPVGVLSRTETCSGGLSGVSGVHPLKRRYYPKHYETCGWMDGMGMRGEGVYWGV